MKTHFFFFLLLCLLCLVHQVCAISAYPEPIGMEQADGSPIVLRLNGDEFDNYYTDEDGFTCLQNDKGDWVFAIQHPSTGELISTGVKVGQRRPPGLASHVRPSKAARERECVNKLCGDISSHGDDRRLSESRRQLANTQGTVQNLVVLIRFSDHVGRSLPSEADITTLMNNQGPDPLCPTGSVWNIFNESSYGQLNLTSTVTPWVTVNQTEAYYANGNSGLTTKTHQLIRQGQGLRESVGEFWS